MSETIRRWLPIFLIAVGSVSVMLGNERMQHLGIINAMLGVGLYIVDTIEDE